VTKQSVEFVFQSKRLPRREKLLAKMSEKEN